MEVDLPFLLCFTLYLRAFSKYKSRGGLNLEGRFNGGFFALPVWMAYMEAEEFVHGEAYFQNFTIIIFADNGKVFFNARKLHEEAKEEGKNYLR